MKDVEDAVLHIGYPKTGTTFLQQKVFPAVAKSMDRVISPDSRYVATSEGFDPLGG